MALSVAMLPRLGGGNVNHLRGRTGLPIRREIIGPTIHLRALSWAFSRAHDSTEVGGLVRLTQASEVTAGSVERVTKPLAANDVQPEINCRAVHKLFLRQHNKPLEVDFDSPA